MDQPARQRRREQLRLAQRRSRQRRQTAMDDLVKENEDLKKQVQELNGLVADLYGLCKDRIGQCQEPNRETLQRLLKASSPVPDNFGAGTLSSISSPYGASLSQHDGQLAPAEEQSSSPEAGHLISVDEVDLENEEWHDPVDEALLYGTSIEHTLPDLGVDPSLLSPEFQPIEEMPFSDETPFSQALPNFSIQDFNASIPKELSIRSLAHTELTLGRQIHRRCIEHVHTLMTLPRIDPRVWTRIFGNELSRPPNPTRDLVVSGLERKFQQSSGQSLRDCRFPEPVLWSRQSQDVARRNRTDVLTPGGVEQLCQNMGLLVLETAPSTDLQISAVGGTQLSNELSLNMTSSDPSPTFWMPGTGLRFNPQRDEEQPAPGKKHVVRPVFAGRGAKKLDIDAFVNYLLQVGFCGVYSPVFYLADVYRAIVQCMVNV